MEEIYKDSIAELKLASNDIVYLKFVGNNTPINQEQSLKILEERKKIGLPGEKQLLLVDLTNNPKPDRGARNVAKSQDLIDITKAMAMIVNSPISRILGNLFLGFNRGDFPVKLFTDEREALDWLLNIE